MAVKKRIRTAPPKVLVTVTCPVCAQTRQLTRQGAGHTARKPDLARCGPCGRHTKKRVDPAKPMCRHCATWNVNRPRRLCWGCYYEPGVKELYPSKSKYAQRGVGHFCGAAPLADAPTTAPPGSAAKIVVMTERARLSQAVTHPADSRYEGDERPLQFLKEKVST